MSGQILRAVQDAASKRVLYLPHALYAMNAPAKLITAEEVRSVVLQGEIIEDYPEDVRGHSCLMLGWGTSRRPIHVVCSPKEDYLAIITAYLPDERWWEADWRTRRPRE